MARTKAEEKSFAQGIAITIGLMIALAADSVTVEEVLDQLAGMGYGVDRLRALGVDSYDIGLIADFLAKAA